jgi:hypothetical protein
MPSTQITGAETLLNKLSSFDWAKWSAQLGRDLLQPYRDLVIVTAQSAASGLSVKINPKDPMLSKFMTTYVMERAKQLDATTKAEIAALIRSKFETGVQAEELKQLIVSAVREKYDGYETWRAARIGRTESAIGYNHANVLGFAQAGVQEVDVVDGTDDEICEEANGQTWTLREALADPIGHPNCTRGLTPIVPDNENESGVGPEEFMAMALNDAPFLAALSEFITSLDDPCEGSRILDAIDDNEE